MAKRNNEGEGERSPKRQMIDLNDSPGNEWGANLSLGSLFPADRDREASPPIIGPPLELSLPSTKLSIVFQKQPLVGLSSIKSSLIFKTSTQTEVPPPFESSPLSTNSSILFQTPPPPPLQLPTPVELSLPLPRSNCPNGYGEYSRQVSAGSTRKRQNPTQKPKDESKSDTVPVPYAWATNNRARVHSLKHLLSSKISHITGQFLCKKCEKQYEVKYNLVDKFDEVAKFVLDNKPNMYDRAAQKWVNPSLPTCEFCKEKNSAMPVIAEKKRRINWLFLFLSQLVGCLKIKDLKYFCKHNQIHRTGAKNRLLYLAYMGLCKQLAPEGPLGA